MEVHQAIDAKYLRLPSRVLFGWLQLDQLELRIPSSQKLAAQETGAPAKSYQRIRSDVVSARLEMRQEHLDAYVAGCGSALAALGVDELELRCCDGYVGLGARVRESALVADLSARLYLSSNGDHLRISGGQPRVYGHLDTPAPIIAHRLMLAIFRAEEERYATVLGLADLALRPLHAALFHCLPAAGWRLPRQSHVEISTVQVTPSGVALRFRDRHDRIRKSEGESNPSQAAASLAETLDEFRSADTLLQRGDLEGAMRGYRGELAARGPEQPFLVERILSIASASREHFIDGLELARQVLGRWPDFAPAHAAIASIAVAQGDVESGARRYRELSQASTAIGDEDGTVRAALAGARLLRQFAADDSTKLYEFVLDHRPGHAESAEALADRYRDEKRWSDLVRLIRMRLATTEDAQSRARDHARLAEVLVERLSAPELALAELVAACRLDESIAAVYQQRAEVELTLSNLDDALSSLESANSLHGQRDDLRARTRNLIRGGQACIDASEYGTAEAWFQAALELSLGNSHAMRGAAQAAAGLGQHKEAARLWRELFDAGVEAPRVQAHFACELGRALLADQNFSDAAAALERATKTGSHSTRAEARAALAQISLHEHKATEALEHLQVAINELDCSDDDDADKSPDGQHSAMERVRRGAELSLKRAGIALDQNSYEDAMFDLRRAFDYARPGDSIRKDAARLLLERTSRNEGELAWLDELSADNDDREERAYLALRRASILAAGEDIEAALAVVATALEFDTISDEPRRAGLQLKAQLLAGLGDNAARADVLAQRAALSGSNAQRAAASVESAQGWLEAGDLERCLAALRLALQRLVDSDSEEATELRASALHLMGECSWKARSWAEVEEAYRSLHAEAPQEAPAESLLRWGTALENLGRAEESVEILEGISRLDEPGVLAAQAFRLLGHLYEQLGKIVKAAQAQERYASSDLVELSDAAQADAWYRAGSLYRHEPACIVDAKRCLAMALAIASDHLPALDALEQIARDEEDHERLAVILGRKIATMSRHPKRQRGLLVRLAELQEHVLGRSDVARETYRRVLEMEPEYRPALRFAARDAMQSGNLPFACDALIKLAHQLPCDADLPLGEERIEEQRLDALFSLAAIACGTAGEVKAGTRELLLQEARSRDDDRLWRALESIYRREQNLVGLADVLGRRTAHVDDEQALRAGLERVDIMFNQLNDFSGALIALRIAQGRHPDSRELARWQTRLESAKSGSSKEPSVESTTAADLAARARALLDEGDWSGAAQLLAPYEYIEDDATLLWLHVEAALGLGEVSRAIRILPKIAQKAQGQDDASAEHRAVRRLADLMIESESDRESARALYKRALQLDANDLVAAELYADLAEDLEQESTVQTAREEVLEIARRTEAGPQQEALALIPLARRAFKEGDAEQAIEHYEHAIALAPTMLDLYRECANVAAHSELYAKAAQWLEALAAQRAVGIADRSAQSENLGDLYLHIAELYYDKLTLPARARANMRLAAEAFGPGMRSNAAYRQLASEAESEGCFEEAIEAYEAIGLEELSGHERLVAAKLFQRVSRDHIAIEILQSARLAGPLSDEETRLLFKLHRGRTRQQEFAAALEQGAQSAPKGIATTRLCEALRIYDDILADNEGSLRIQHDLDKRNPNWRSHQPGTVSELERTAEAAAADEAPVAATLLARAIELHTAALASSGGERDERCDGLLERLRDIATTANQEGVHSAKQAANPSETEALVRGLLAVVTIEEDQARAAKLLREVAMLRHRGLHDARAAADALGQALSMQAGDALILADLDAMLREAGDYRQLASAYELQLSVISGPRRSRPLITLGRICHDVLNEPDRARQCFLEAAEADGSVAAEVGQLLSQLRTRSSPSYITDQEVSQELDKAAALEALGKTDQARAVFEATAAMAPQDARPFLALRRIYREQGDRSKIGRVLEQLTTLSNTPKERASLFFERASLARKEQRDDVLAYEFLKEAAANDPDETRYSHALRTMAMARGEWALAAELTYREIAATSEEDEQGALYLELALIYDEKLLDAAQAVINYEQALALDPEIPAAPKPLARLYELANRHGEATHMFQKAARCARSKEDRALLLRHAATNAEQSGQPDRAKELYALMHEVTTGTPMLRVPDPSTPDAMPEEPTLPLTPMDTVEALEAELQGSEIKDTKERAQLLLELGRAYQQDRGDQTAALGAYEQALQADPELVKATNALAELAYQQRDWGRAHLLYQQVPTGSSELEPAELAMRQAEISEALGQEEAAYHAYKSALEFAPEDTQVLAGVCRSATRVEQYAEAFLAQQTLIRLIPVDQVDRLCSARIVLAELCEQMGDIDEAIRSYESLLRDEPDSVVALSRVPRLYMDNDRAEDAIRALHAQLRVTLAPRERAGVLFDLGETYRLLNEDVELAADSYFKAIDLDPGHVPTLRRLLHYYCEAGDFESANEMARELEKQGSLLETDTGLPLLHRAALAAALGGNDRLCMFIGHSLGQGSVTETARALRETFQIANPPSAETLAVAAQAVCQATGDSFGSVISALEDSDAGKMLQSLVKALHELAE